MRRLASRKLWVLVGYITATFATMWGFALLRAPDAAWQTFGTVSIALMGPVMAWVGVQGWLDRVRPPDGAGDPPPRPGP